MHDQSTFEDEFIILKQAPQQLRIFLQTKTLEETLGTSDYQRERVAKKKLQYNPIMESLPSQQPIFMTGGLLHPFQIEGVKWLLDGRQKGNNLILADEMGLGKTVQSISHLYQLYYEKNLDGPFLIIAPASTIFNWQKEFAVWAEKFNVIVYMGNQASKQIIRQKEFYYKLKNKSTINKRVLVPKFNALISSFETVIQDIEFLSNIIWESMIIDEAHRLKNCNSKTFKVIQQISAHHKVLLTGTPLQNNIGELVNLIDFILPHKARLIKQLPLIELLEIPGRQSQENQTECQKSLGELTNYLAPHLLRRKKQDVNLQLPAMEETLIKIGLSAQQKYLYKNVILRNHEKLRLLDDENKKNKVSKVSLINILMSLRLVCNHPHLLLYHRKFPYPQDEQELKEFVTSSNKLLFLQKMLPKLVVQQRKVLIFSQFTMMLDILAVFLANSGIRFERLDGTTSVIDRQKRIDNFNSKSSSSSVFLLSTRAGGLGINLTSADTIFFTDSDFNPYRDIQAISRAHRMGQTQKVIVFRLVSKFTAEEKVIEMAAKKLLLESIVINPLKTLHKNEFEAIIRTGTLELFSDDNLNEEITDEQIERLLNRDNIGNKDEKAPEISQNELTDFYLSGFKLTTTTFECNPKHKGESREKLSQKYWNNILDADVKKLHQLRQEGDPNQKPHQEESKLDQSSDVKEDCIKPISHSRKERKKKDEDYKEKPRGKEKRASNRVSKIESYIEYL